MTICIAAACDSGKRIVSASDGLLSLGDVTGDTMAGKVIWKGEWQILYAGLPGNIAMILGELDEMLADDADGDLLSRRKVQETIRTAFRKFVASASSFEALAPFYMTLDEFKKDGRASLGPKTHEDLSYQIRVKANQIQEQMLVAGWGFSPASAMLYEVAVSGCQNHSYSGIATIGSGSRIATSYLLTLGQGRDCTLAETVFNVAMAKFASEKSEGLDVGPRTAIYISRKPAKGEPLPCTEPLLEEEILSLRQIWQEEVKPRITKQGHLAANRIAQRIAGGITATDMARTLQAKS